MNEPEIGTSSSLDTRNVAKSVNQSINWFSGCDKMEILNGVNGKTLSEAGGGKQSISRLCKSSIFAQWIALSIAATGVKKQENLYADAKAAATDYQEAKKAANSSLETGGFSSWVSKPLEIDSFALS
ncbi:unnamed protein product [Notodromas monacha]|uniref:A to I editase domain-containing protein n=1 Tax=Notodromas monacha TaxID=399045 RepID=A0A7R9BR89_9CRUS|nr:unnamed protein product [Notodromas monacha]CAG0918860.1 unnamed protein product [Notodromas monacha]